MNRIGRLFLACGLDSGRGTNTAWNSGMRSSKETLPDQLAHLGTRRSRVLRDYVKQRQLSREHERFLGAVVDGHRGEGLRIIMEANSLRALEERFEHRANISVYRASIQVLQRTALVPAPKVSAG